MVVPLACTSSQENWVFCAVRGPKEERCEGKKRRVSSLARLPIRNVLPALLTSTVGKNEFGVHLLVDFPPFSAFFLPCVGFTGAKIHHSVTLLPKVVALQEWRGGGGMR